jgi:Leucine Rich Repeat (LRR) protein
MLFCKTAFSARIATALCLCAAGGCAPTTAERPNTVSSARSGSASRDADYLKLRELKAEVTAEKNGLGKSVVSIDLSLVRDVTPALRLAADLPSVERLSLVGASLHPEDLQQLQKMLSLRWLDLSNTTITDADLAFLEFTPRLEFLLLWSTGITDGGLQHIARLARLQKLDLSGTKISDNGLDRLSELHDLLELYVEVPGLGEAKLERLQQKLPNTLIVH